MPIEVVCRGCNARYRVKDDLAGRMAECKHCGQKFRVPYRSAVVRLGDEEEVGAPVAPAPAPAPARAKSKRDFVEYGLDPNDPTAPIGKPKKERPKVKQGILPELVADLWLPLGLLIVCYGIALYTAASHLLRSNGPVAGMILLGIVVAMFFALVIPMTMRMIEGASKTLDFEAPNAIWLQTAGLIGLPTMGMVVGFFGAGSIAAAIAGGLIGFVVMIPPLALMFRIDFLKGIQAAVLAGMFYVLSLAGTGAVIAAVALWLMPVWKLTRPWDEPAPPANEVVAASPASPADTSSSAGPQAIAAAAPSIDAPPAPAEAGASPLSAPSPLATATPATPAQVWEVAADPFPSHRWPPSVHHLFDVRPPVDIIRASPRGPVVGIVDRESTRVFDLRSGKRLGRLNERPQPGGSVLSRDGTFIVLRPQGSSALEVWSVADERMMLRVEGTAHPNARGIGFDASGRLHVATLEKGQPVVRTWDVRTRALISTTAVEPDPATALSGNARLMASLRPGRLRVYDLQRGEMVGEKKIDAAFKDAVTLQFSDDGTKLAGIVLGQDGQHRVLVWGTTDGALSHDHPVAAPPVGRKASDIELAWTPDGDGIMVGGQLIDLTTGKTIATPEVPTASGAVGRPLMPLTNFQTLFEIAPQPNGERVIYRSVAHPRAEVISALRGLRGPSWSPTPEATAAVETVAAETAGAETAAATTDAQAPALAASAPASRPANPALLKEWVVTVLAVTAPDGPSIERQLRAEQQKLGPAESAHASAAARHDALAGDYITVPDGFGGSTKKRRYSAREIGQAKAAAVKAAEEVRDVKSDIARLQRELKAVSTTRVVTGKLDDGTPVTINVEAAPLVALVDPLTSGARVKVTGSPRFIGGTLEVRLRTLSPVD